MAWENRFARERQDRCKRRTNKANGTRNWFLVFTNGIWEADFAVDSLQTDVAQDPHLLISCVNKPCDMDLY